ENGEEVIHRPRPELGRPAEREQLGAGQMLAPAGRDAGAFLPVEEVPRFEDLEVLRRERLAPRRDGRVGRFGGTTGAISGAEATSERVVCYRRPLRGAIIRLGHGGAPCWSSRGRSLARGSAVGTFRPRTGR